MNRCCSRSHTRRGFTLIELLVVITIIAILVSIAVPAIFSARAAARSSQCAAYLKNFGIALNAHATSDPSGRFCSGAYDWTRDGCPTNYGWVADVVNGGSGVVTDMMCPSSTLRGSEKYNDLVGVDPSSEQALPANLQFRLLDGKYCSELAALDPTDPAELAQRANLVAQLLTDGYGTNYASSWQLVRSAPVTDRAGLTTGELKSLNHVVGPLTARRLEQARISSNVVPFLGCGAPGDVKDAVMSASIPGFVNAGDRVAESFNDGPARASSGSIGLMPTGTNVVGAIPSALPSEANNFKTGTTEANMAGADGILWLQDTRDWYAWHGTGSKKSCNILMADGSVRKVADKNGDGYLSPGFNMATATADVDGFVGQEVELLPNEVYSGPFLPIPGLQKLNFEKPTP